MAFFSVIIPVYNKQNFVYNTIQSVLSQTFSDFEIIIINDGSTDESEKEIMKFSDERINYIKQHNKGLSASRNKGIKIASSKYLTFLDSDDIWHPGYLEKIIYLINSFPSEKIFATNYYDIYPNGIKLLPKNLALQFKEDAIIRNYFSLNLGQPFYIASCLCVEKSVFKTIGYFNEKITYAEDVDFNIRSNLKFNTIFTNKPYIDYYVFSENQITTTGLKDKTIPDFSFYKKNNINNKELNVYLDFNLYTIAKMYKMDSDFKNFKKIYVQIDLKNLNFKQKCLLKMPRFLLLILKIIARLFIKFGIRFSSYG